MKIWQSYGAEHSANLVLIGRFKEIEDAEEFETEVDSLIEFMRTQDDFDFRTDRFDDEILEFLWRKKIHSLNPSQLGQFILDIRIERKDKEIWVNSEESDLSGLITLLVDAGARVEIFSRHDYPEEKE